MWHSTLSVLIGNDKDLLTGVKNTETSGLSHRQEIFLDLKKTLTVLCSIFLTLTLVIGVLYISISTSPAAFKYYFELESFLICLGSIQVIVSIRLIHLLRKGVDETKNKMSDGISIIVSNEDNKPISKSFATENSSFMNSEKK